jgi:hypothetical protein
LGPAPKLEDTIPTGTNRKIGRLQEYVQKNPSKAAKVEVWNGNDEKYPTVLVQKEKAFPISPPKHPFSGMCVHKHNRYLVA